VFCPDFSFFKVNILVKDDGVCCVADFGIAVFAEMHVSWTTSSTRIRGADRWLAPELLDPEHPPKPSTTRDIYSLGCLIYEVSICPISEI
jgi:serine/threonine protein kinase